MKYILLTLFFVTANLFASPYTDLGNGTVLDNASGLTWQKCQAGRSGLDCETGNVAMHSWKDSIAYCEKLSLDGLRWRLPERNELSTLIARDSSTSPMIDQSFFPNTSLGAFWTGTGYAFWDEQGWRIEFNYGGYDRQPKVVLNEIRCVSGEKKPPSYKKNQDGTVTDVTTGLVWQECSRGQAGSDCVKGKPTTHSWQEAVTYCENLDLAKRTWRLAEISELETLVDLKKNTSPTIDSKMFPLTDSVMHSNANGYWSYTSHAKYNNRAYAVSFFLGDVGNQEKDQKSSYIRCVAK